MLLSSLPNIEKADGKLSIEYLDGVWRISQMVGKSKDKRIKSEWMKTDPLPADALNEYQELQAAWKVVEELRDKIVARFQNVLAGRKKSV